MKTYTSLIIEQCVLRKECGGMVADPLDMGGQEHGLGIVAPVQRRRHDQHRPLDLSERVGRRTSVNGWGLFCSGVRINVRRPWGKSKIETKKKKHKNERRLKTKKERGTRKRKNTNANTRQAGAGWWRRHLLDGVDVVHDDRVHQSAREPAGAIGARTRVIGGSSSHRQLHTAWKKDDIIILSHWQPQ